MKRLDHAGQYSFFSKGHCCGEAEETIRRACPVQKSILPTIWASKAGAGFGAIKPDTMEDSMLQRRSQPMPTVSMQQVRAQRMQEDRISASVSCA